MKYVYISMWIVLITMMVGCNENENSESNTTVNDLNQQFSDEYKVDEIDDLVEIGDLILDNIRPYFINEGNRIYVYDLKTWSLSFTYEVENYDIAEVVEVLENGYLRVFVRNYDAWDLAWQEWWANNDDWPERDDYGEFIDFTLPEENGYPMLNTFLIFDKKFNLMDSFSLENFYHILFSKYENGELILYVETVNLDDLASRMLTYYRINFSTGERDELFQMSADIRILGDVDDHHFLGLSDYFYFGEQIGQEAPPMFRETSFGLVNIETGEKNFFTVEDFGHGDTGIVGSWLLISEMNSPHLEQTNRVILFNMETETYEIIQLLPNDSHIVQLSSDGNHIVAANLAENLFRRYDIEGNVLFETSIEIEFELIFGELLPFHHVRLFEVDEHMYAICYTPWLGEEEGGRQVEFIDVTY